MSDQCQISCEECGFVTRKQKTLVKHMRKRHGKRALACPWCAGSNHRDNSSSSSVAGLCAHKQLQHRSLRLRCFLCEFTSRRLSRWVGHMTRRHRGQMGALVRLTRVDPACGSSMLLPTGGESFSSTVDCHQETQENPQNNPAPKTSEGFKFKGQKRNSTLHPTDGDSFSRAVDSHQMTQQNPQNNSTPKASDLSKHKTQKHSPRPFPTDGDSFSKVDSLKETRRNPQSNSSPKASELPKFKGQNSFSLSDVDPMLKNDFNPSESALCTNTQTGVEIARDDEQKDRVAVIPSSKSVRDNSTSIKPKTTLCESAASMKSKTTSANSSSFSADCSLNDFEICESEMEYDTTVAMSSTEPHRYAADSAFENCEDQLIVDDDDVLVDSSTQPHGAAADSGDVPQDSPLTACPYCDALFSSIKDLRHHCRSEHAQGSTYPCRQCNYSAVSVSKLVRHMTVHRNPSQTKSPKPVTCPYCSRTFSSLQALGRHCGESHGGQGQGQGPPLHKCPHCAYSTKWLYLLVRHVRIHTQEKPFACTLCPYRVCHYTDLYKHMRMHRDERPFACPMCPDRFIQANHLARHIQYHTQEKPYVCEVCSVRYADANTLRAHLEKGACMGYVNFKKVMKYTPTT